MKRPFRTGLVAGLLALTLGGAACGSGSSPAKAAKSEGAVSATAPAAPDTTAPAPVETSAPAAVTPTTAAAKPATPAPTTPKVTVTTAKSTTTTTTAKPQHVTLRLGYFPNVTHASAIAGIEKGIYADKLRPHVTLQPSIFNARRPPTE